MPEKKCKPGMVWCPNSKKCIPEEEQRSQGQGRGMGRGQGKGPIGVPTKEDRNMLDLYLEEVEIKNIYLQEFDPMSVPLQKIIDQVSRKIYRLNDYRGEIIDRIERYSKEVVDLEKGVRLQPHNKVKIGTLAHHKKELKFLFKKRDEFNDKYYAAKETLHKLKNDPGMLTKIPYLYQIIGATLILAAVAYSSYKIYKRFMSKAAKACQDKKGNSKSICMIQYQIKGLEASKKPLTQGIKGCSNAEDSYICKAKYNKKINTIDKKIDKKKNQIKKLMTVKKEDKNMLRADQLVDEILLGDYSLFKKLEEGDVSVDNVLDEIENSIDHVPDQDLPELQQSVEDDLTKDSNTPVEERVILFKEGMKTELKAVTVKCKKEFQDVSEVRTCMAEAMKSMYHNWMVSQLPVDRITPIEEQMLASVKLLSEDAYKEFFKKMLSKYGVKTPSELSDDKKKEFFNAVDKGWKANKESD